MYHRLGNLYTNQRLGAFESDGTGFGEGFAKRLRGGRHRLRMGGNLKRLSAEQLTDKLTSKEAKIVTLQQQMAAGKAGPNAARRLARLQARATKIRETLVAKKPNDVLEGLGDLPAVPVGLGVVAAAAAGYWFLVRPRLAKARRKNRRKR